MEENINSNYGNEHIFLSQITLNMNITPLLSTINNNHIVNYINYFEHSG